MEISYDCHGRNVVNWWAINGVSLLDQAALYQFDKHSQNLKYCVDTLTLRLLKVHLNYTGDYVAYPSKDTEFSTDGIHKIVHLGKSIRNSVIKCIHVCASVCSI